MKANDPRDIEQLEPHDENDLLDEALKETFPASDPIAVRPDRTRSDKTPAEANTHHAGAVHIERVVSLRPSDYRC
ncbi:hypothetical protein [Caballeronia ptereochthonis]|uniref:Uncharacterized protein n=1 Tax=Caballeronia ptereochthonis TaxID=1777144 RepID=A0A158AII7_9BURK|nr:hypothetical protein [Caballeronia ptereochthonis]SAK57638.1 hypothetical protein AWB83_01900 [Caballeronia ptereochthonis]